MKGDERILGDNDFVETVLKACRDEFDRKYLLKSGGHDFYTVVDRVAEVLEMNRSEVLSSGRQPHKVQARSLLCFWASRNVPHAPPLNEPKNTSPNYNRHPWQSKTEKKVSERTKRENNGKKKENRKTD